MSIFSNHELPDQMGPEPCRRDRYGDLAGPEEEAGPDGHFGSPQPTEEDWRDYERWALAGADPLHEYHLLVARAAGTMQGLALRLRITGQPDDASAADRLEALALELLVAQQHLTVA